jgi:SAM-dependent methyltransferase
MSPEEAWQSALNGEVGFWSEWLRTKGARYPGSYESRLDPVEPLQPEIGELLDAPEGATLQLLDVGAGPFTFLGRTSPKWNLEITAVDALADEYAKLTEKFGVVAPVPTKQCETENLSTLFAPSSFDLVAARNTLDHSYDPVRAIREMATCARAGAPVLLVHHRNTGEDENYHGMHQWNFEADDGSLIVWRPSERHNVVEELGGLASIERVWVDGAWEHVVLRRAHDDA